MQSRDRTILLALLALVAVSADCPVGGPGTWKKHYGVGGGGSGWGPWDYRIDRLEGGTDIEDCGDGPPPPGTPEQWTDELVMEFNKHARVCAEELTPVTLQVKVDEEFELSVGRNSDAVCGNEANWLVETGLPPCDLIGGVTVVRLPGGGQVPATTTGILLGLGAVIAVWLLSRGRSPRPASPR
jgi:hypothetical protein